MRRYVPILIAGSALIVAACRDAIAPTRSETPVTTALRPLGDRSFAMVVAPGEGTNAETTTFTLSPHGGTVSVAGFRVDYPANAVCDPATSGYGNGTWDQDCVTLDSPITITARHYKSNGRMHVEFQPDVRFAPDKNVIMSVVRSDLVGRDLSAEEVQRNNVWYAVVDDGTRHYVDEAWEDPSLATRFEKDTGKLFRRIKHFSWYNVRTGEECDPAAGDPDCQEGPPGGGF